MKNPLVSLIIPAYNEQTWLPRSLSRIHQAIQFCNLEAEVIVVDNNSQDRTAEIAREHGAIVVHEPVNQISLARNRGASMARAPFLVFVDADTLLSGPLLQKAIEHLQEGWCGGGALLTLVPLTSSFARPALSLWNFLAKHRSLFCGCFVFCRHDAFMECGGFETSVYAGEEILLARKLRRWHRRHKKSRAAKKAEYCDPLKSLKIIENPKIVSSSRKLNHPFRAVLTTALIAIFPFTVFFRCFCGFWYRRPPEE